MAKKTLKSAKPAAKRQSAKRGKQRSVTAAAGKKKRITAKKDVRAQKKPTSKATKRKPPAPKFTNSTKSPCKTTGSADSTKEATVVDNFLPDPWYEFLGKVGKWDELTEKLREPFYEAAEKGRLPSQFKAYEKKLRADAVLYCIAEVFNGGFSQFFYNVQGDMFVIMFTVAVLEQAGAKVGSNLLMKTGLIWLNDFSDKQRAAFLKSKYFGKNKERDALDVHSAAFVAAESKNPLNMAKV